MIRELGRIPRARLVAAAHALESAGRGVALLDGEGWGGTWVAADPVEELRVPIGAGSFDAIAAALDRSPFDPRARGWNGRRPSLQWIGYLAYEGARSLERPTWTRGGGVDDRARPTGEAALLRRHAAVARLDAQTGIVSIEGDDADAIARLEAAIVHAPPRGITPSIELLPTDDDAQHVARIEKALAWIAAGDLYQVNVARRFSATTTLPATAVLAAMRARTNARFGAAIDFGDHAIASSSPELFLDVHQGRVRTSPIKGTRPRGVDAASDRALRDELDLDPKERAELTMIVDLERNDLGRIAQVGTVRVPGAARIESSSTVHHRVDDVTARVGGGVSLGSILRATFPSGSVTGAPKVRAMEVIAGLESDRRGIYCGAIVALDRAGGLRASMAIRTAVLDRAARRVDYHAGGGIVADSDPIREVAETGWKARQVMAR